MFCSANSAVFVMRADRVSTLFAFWIHSKMPRRADGGKASK